MVLTYDLRARPLLVIALLAVAAAAVGLFVLGRMHRSSGESAKPAATAPRTHRATTKAPAPAPAHGARARKAPAPTPAPSDQLPAAIRRAFAADRVVVVSLYDPKAKIDGTALLEAKAGAELAGSAFVPVDVRRNTVDVLNARYGVIQDPALLVLRPPGVLVVRIDGFADRDTVAQAALNAGP